MRPFFFAASIALLSAGCVSIGTNYDQAALNSLQPGMTTDQVVQRLGQPNSVATLPDGRTQLLWVHSRGSMFGANARSVALVFGPDGKLIRTVNQTQTQVQ